MFEERTPSRLAGVVEPVSGSAQAARDVGTGEVAFTPVIASVADTAASPEFAQWMAVVAPSRLG
ncbi:hypothetical protein NGM37_05350, partial [Streptomyces sp. TRM76130]|nr:hypothetical protein [Streptomyces sp. TRM76130]